MAYHRLSHCKHADKIKNNLNFKNRFKKKVEQNWQKVMKAIYTSQTLSTSSDLEVSKGFYIQRFDGNTSAALAHSLSLALCQVHLFLGYFWL